MSIQGTATVINQGIIAGGNGGQGGQGGSSNSVFFYGGMGGNGGTGVEIADGATLNNSGTISGGNAGASGILVEGGTLPAALAGVGVTADSNTVVINSGAIIAGRDASGAPGTTALRFTGANNRLELQSGYSFQGNVIAAAPGVTNTLALGGDTDGIFDVRQIAATAPLVAGSSFYGFTNYEKTGTSTWRLDQETRALTNWTIKAGTLSPLVDTSFGDPAGSVTLAGGTLKLGNGFNTSRSIILDPAGGTIDVEARDYAGINSFISGSGSLTKSGSGTLYIRADNRYTGSTYVTGGELRIGMKGGSFQGNVVLAPATRLGFLSDYPSLYSGSITGDGGVFVEGAPLTITGANTYTGKTTVNNAMLQIGAGGTTGSIVSDVYLTDLSTLVFNRSDDFTYAGTLSGGAAVVQIGSGLLTLTGDSSRFAGLTTVAAGGLEVDGKLGTGIVVQNRALLAGTGEVGATHIQNGGTLSPGNATNPTGTLTINGDLVMDSGSTYRVMAAADGSHGALLVNGAATLSGSVVQIGSGTTYAAQTTYNILQASHGVWSQFSSVESNYAYLTPSLVYSADKVDLVIDLKQVPAEGDSSAPGGNRDIRFADLATNGNQRATANALQSLPVNTPLYGRILNLPNGAPSAVFQSLSGESHASASSTLFGVADNAASLPLQHLRANLNAGMMRGQPTAQLGGGDASSLPQSAAQPVWAQVFGDWRTLGGSKGSTEVRQSDGGLFVGGDQHVGGGWRLGGALGYTGSHSTAKGLSSRTDIDSYSGVIYGGKAYAVGPGKINLSLGAGYTWHDIDTRRNVDAAGVGQSLKASYSGNTSQVFGELGYALPLTDRIGLEPFVGADYNDQRIRGFSESGGDAALSGKSGHNKVGSTTLGMRLQSTFESGASQGRAYASAGWRHAYGDLDPATTLAFQGSQSFTVAGAPLARDAAVFSLGADLAITRSATVGLAYNGQYGGGNRQNSGAVTVRWRF
ncbi:autotransporter domain-containing protein [Bordetella sp. N]|uniref:autotransporter family protein n=1 Tax=Bordetella sp. N TaxID=1746199 RepID=UPI00070E5B17|nr:autotransporter domain-containing protein [Bordetella sp. N]ALM86015.1 hypothetical protein ASB57_26415 [Bordetella sp. N]